MGTQALDRGRGLWRLSSALGEPVLVVVRQPLGALAVWLSGAFLLAVCLLGVATAREVGGLGPAAAAGFCALALLAARAGAWRVLARGEGALAALPRLGLDEARVGVTFVFGLFAAAVPAVLLFVLGAAWGEATDVRGLDLGAGLVGLLVGLVFFVRFVLAGAASVARRRVVFFRSWALSAGVFWSLAALIAVGAVLVVGALALLSGARNLADLADLARSALAFVSLDAVTSAPLVAALLCAVGGLVHLVTAAPLAYAYRALHAERHGVVGSALDAGAEPRRERRAA